MSRLIRSCVRSAGLLATWRARSDHRCCLRSLSLDEQLELEAQGYPVRTDMHKLFWQA